MCCTIRIARYAFTGTPFAGSRDSGARRMTPGDEASKARIKEIQDLGFTATKIDIDEAGDPARFDRGDSAIKEIR